MRYVCLSAVTAAILSSLCPLSLFGQGAQGLSITNYQLVSEQRWSQTQSYMTYRADLVNTGAARSAVTASVKSLISNVQVVNGQGNLHFSPVPASGQVTSSNSFTLFVDHSAPFSWTDLQWNFLAPVANAGPGQTVKLGSTVTLDASGSSNPSGYGSLMYSWTFTSRPVGTGAVLFNADMAKPYFVVDAPGNYVLVLTVSNGAGSDTATVTVSTSNSAPVANAGPNQTASLNALVTLNGSGSSDVDGDPLSYTWTMISCPNNSIAALVNARTVAPSFVADKPGSFIVQLIVNDGKVDSLPTSVMVTTQNTAPVARAGSNQVVAVGALVQLNGSASSDVDGNPLTYRWSFLSTPTGSAAKLSNTAAVSPTFTADAPGNYIAQLIVNDGFVDSTASTVTITTSPTLAPIADAGPNQTVPRRATVTLTGSGRDPQGLTLTYAWSLTTKPTGSSAVLSSTTIANPTFVADYPGTYVVQLIVSNGSLSSAPATVTITTTNTPPVANPGSNQNVALGALVTLNGSGSSDADGDTLTYAWSFMSRPTGSTAALTGATTASPTFSVDLGGTYVVQLIVNDGFASSTPSTVTILAGVNSITLTPNPLNLGPGKSGTLTVTLATAAGTGGVTISLAISDPGVATVPASVTIASGLTGANVTVTAGTGTGSATILANTGGYTPGIATVIVAVPSIGISLDAGTVGITHSVNGTITLSTPAPVGGVNVSLSATPGGLLTLQPTLVPINAGSISGSFTVTGDQTGSATIQATAPGYDSGSATVTVGMLGAIMLPSNVTVGPGQSVAFPVKLATGAPMGGVTITLNSGDTSILTVSPSTVFVAQANTTPAVQPQVTGFKVGSATVIATAPGMYSDMQTVQVAASLNFSPQVLTLGVNSTQNLTLSLSGPAPAGGLIINLSSSNPAAVSVPGTVTMLSSTTSVAVPVTATALGQAVIHASALPAFPDTTANVTVVNIGVIGMPSSLSVALGQSVPFPVSLPSAAPAGGVTISLSSSDTSKVTVSPSTVTIPPGQTAPVSQPQVSGVNLGTANINVSASGFTGGSAPVQVTATVAFSPPNPTISGLGTQNLTLTLSAPSPTGVSVNLSSSNTAIVTVPASVTFPVNSTTVTVPVKGLAFGNAVIHANASPNIPDTTANVTVQAGNGVINLPSNVTVPLGQSVTFAVSLSLAAPVGGVTVTLASSDNSKVSLTTTSVTIPEGAIVPATQPKVNGLNLGTVTLTATATGYTAVNTSVQVTASLSFSPQNLTIGGITTQNLALNLSGPAPTGGLTVNVSSSNPAVATVPASVTFPANATSVNVPVTAIAGGSAVIHASLLPNLADTTANISVQTGIVLPSNITVEPGQSVAYAVSLSSPAPAGGVFITLTSSDVLKATLSMASLFVVEGQTMPSGSPRLNGINYGVVTITATATGYTTASQQVQVCATLTFSPGSMTMVGNGPENIGLSLSSFAPAGGLVVNLNSSKPSVATVPASVTIPANMSTATIAVTGVAPGSTTITASTGLATVPNATASVTIATPGTITLPSNPTIALGQSAPFAISVSSPAPAGGLTITLSSSDVSKVAISPVSVFIPQGSTTPSTQPQVTGSNIGAVTIAASAPNTQSASTSVTVNATVTFVPNVLTITGTTIQNIMLNLSGPAPLSGITMNLSSSNAGVATVPAVLTFYPDGSSFSSLVVPVTGVSPGTTVIHASALPYIADVTANITVLSPGTISLPSGVTISPGQSAAFSVTLGKAAPAGGVTVSLSSSDITKVTVSPSVTIAGGQTTAAVQPQVTGVSFGAANITASAPGYATTSAQVQVQAKINFAQTDVTIVGLVTQNLTLNLSGAAPAGGLTVNVSSSNTAIATVPTTVTFAAGTTSVNVPVTAVAVGGPAVIHASALPLITDTTASVTVQSSGSIAMPASVSVGLGQSAALQVALPSPAPAGGVTVTLSSNDPSKVGVTSTVSIAAGQTSPPVQPQVSGVNLGSATVTASASGYVPGSTLVQVTVSASFSPNSVTISGINSGTLMLTLSGAAPSGGLMVSLFSSDTTVATVPPTAVFTAGATGVSIPVMAVAAGTAVIHAAAAPYIADTTATVTVGTSGSAGTLSLGSTSIGKDLQTVVPLTLSPAAPSGGLPVTLTSSDPSRVLIGTISSNLGVPSLTVTLSEGSQSSIIILQGLADNGTVAVTASAPGWSTGTANVTLTPSGFVLAGPGGVGVLSFPTNVGINTPMIVYSARLDSSLHYVENQVLRGGISVANPGGLVVRVPLSSGSPGVGMVSPASVQFSNADSISANLTFTALDVGSTTLTAGVPAGFSTPINANNVVASVGTSGLVPSNVTVGRNLEAAASVILNGAPSNDVYMTISSNDPSKALLSTTRDGDGSASISVKVKAGFTHTPDFYVYGLDNSGTVGYTAALDGFGTASGSITLVRSGVMIAGPFGLGMPISTTTGATPTTLTISTGMFDAGGNYLGPQPVSGMGLVSVNVSSGNAGIGTITQSPVSIPAGSDNTTTQFQPSGNGSTSISVNTPSGFSTPGAYGSVSVTVSTAGIAITDGVSIGKNLAYSAYLSLGQTPPPGGVTVTLTSNNSSQLLLAANPTDKGSASITLKIVPPAFGAAYYLYALDSSGTTGYTASAPGYVTRSATAISFTPSGIVLEGSFGIGSLLFAPLSAGDTPFYVHAAQLTESGGFIQTGPLAGGQSVTVSLTSTNPQVGTVPAQVTIAGGSDTTKVMFHALSGGPTTIMVATPPGFTSPTTGGSISTGVF